MVFFLSSTSFSKVLLFFICERGLHKFLHEIFPERKNVGQVSDGRRDSCVSQLLQVQESPYRTPLATAFVQAGVELGYPHLDCNGAQQTGFMLAQGTVRRGSRCSTNKAFLRPVASLFAIGPPTFSIKLAATFSFPTNLA